MVFSPSLVPAGGQAPARKKIVLIAGKKSHGPVGNGQHDYGWSVLLLKALLESSNVADKIAVTVHLDGWPRDEKAVADADTIMVVSDGRDGNAFAEALHIENDERVALVDRLVRRGCGVVTFHFSTFAPEKYADKVLEWNGGYFKWETDGKRQWFSAIRTLAADVKLGAADHPISRGVAAGFAFRDEFYYKLKFREGDPRLKPVLLVPALGGTPEQHTVAWAIERADGGRGFGTTCGHAYEGWKNDDFRRLILNAVCWTAKVEIPAAGVNSTMFTHEEIRRLVGAPPGAEAKSGADSGGRGFKALLFAGNDAHKWHNWERTTPAIKAALERDGRVRVDVSHNIEDLATAKLSDYAVIVQNYVNWHDPKPLSEPAKAAFLKFVEGGGGLVVIHFANGAWHSSLPMAGASDWPDYRRLVRRVWDHKGGSGHDRFGPFTVDFTAVKHPITDGLKAFEVTDELYFRQAGDEPIEPLITARSKITGKDEPLAFAYSVGKGRVFQTLLGHSEKTYGAFEAREMVRRAAAWAAGREVRPLTAAQESAAK